MLAPLQRLQPPARQQLHRRPSPALRRPQPRVGTDLFKLAAQALQLLLVCRPLVRTLGGALFGARFRGDNLLAGDRNLGVGVGSDLFKVVADSL